jgi:6-pyruvoyltetrahydropterin/6-carboxytetrahydropterin synthase
MISITRLVEFDAAHRLMEHESKCRFVHGHRYVAEATFTAAGLDAVGRVIDFSVIKQRLQGWVDEHWDHTIILHHADHALGSAIDAITGQKTYYMPMNPTAENMAQYLANTINILFADVPIRLTKLTLSETPRCSATIML